MTHAALLTAFRSATLAARARMGDPLIGVTVERGASRVVRVTYHGITSTVEPLTVFAPHTETLASLTALSPVVSK